LLYFNARALWGALKGPFPMNAYTGKYFELGAAGRIDEGRAYLLENCTNPERYDQMYQVLLFSFGQDPARVEDFLRKHDFWRPDWVHTRLDQAEHARLVAERWDLCARDIRYAKALCEKEGALFVLQDYPFFDEYWTAELNARLRALAAELGVPFVDQEALFRSVLGAAPRKFQTFTHVDARGHALMARNLSRVLVERLRGAAPARS
jgi:hypothetical protein